MASTCLLHLLLTIMHLSVVSERGLHEKPVKLDAGGGKKRKKKNKLAVICKL